MSTVPAGYKQTEVGVIPQEWDVKKIESILSEISMGPFGSDIKVSNFVSDGVPVLSGANVRSERLEDSFTNFVTPAKAKSLKKAVARRGDIVVTHRGTLGQISYIPDDSAFDSYVISQSQFRAHFNADLVTPTWVTMYFLSAQGATKLLEGKGHTGVPALAQATTKFRLLHIPLPPLPEQRAIAAALSDVDALLAKLDQLIAKKRDLKQAAMQQLLTGQTRLPGFHSEWEETTLGQIGECIIGLTYKPENVVEHGLLVLRSSNVQNGRLAYNDNVYVNLQVAERLYTQPGDILVCVRNGSRALIGKCAVIDSIAVGLTFGAFMSVYRTKYWRYVIHAFQGDDIQRQIRDNIGATINQITNKDMKAFRLTLPPEDEQTAIATVLSDMDAELAVLEARRDKTRALKQGMMQELLTGRIRLV